MKRNYLAVRALSVRTRTARPWTNTLLAGVCFLISSKKIGIQVEWFKVFFQLQTSLSGPMSSGPVASLILLPIHLTPSHPLQPPLTPCCSLNMSGLPQGLCTCYSCCLEQSFPDILLAHSFASFRSSHKDHFLKVSPATQSKIVASPSQTHSVPFIFLLVCFALNHIYILYNLLIQYVYYLIHILECKFHRAFILFTALSPEF